MAFMELTKYTSNMRRAVRCVEKNIGANITYADAAMAAGMSPDNFWRVFKRCFGDTPDDYIKARKMAVVARRLTGTNKRISEIAAGVGFGRQEILTRAFRKHFFMTPTEYRKKGANLIFFERSKLTDAAIGHFLRGGISLEPSVRRVKEFEICGVQGAVSMQNAIPGASAIVLKLIMGKKKLLGRGGGESYVFAEAAPGRSVMDISQRDRIELLFGYPAGVCDGGLARKKVPGGNYAVFRHRGNPAMLWVSYEYIFGSWLKKRRMASMPSHIFERGSSGFVAGSSLWIDIYVPVKSRKKPL